ncbi:hypothetical protein BGZ80_000565 [Entomortierella chlamydospora]|uniref:INO80 complex subunit E N-terminal domain-containing protein n=1 Tax=Entomortierella chlamydospora TaxID=101097 RepID=A0A9P6MS82_9FUNG|nr:hypothetical protein BGZ79_000660 [Entomortierella chlamydospora]KAG0011593.1 hypothetical protein BGZ80_000565 [Entomortierella chlamydospora]
MVPANTDIDMRPTTPPPVGYDTPSNLNVFKDKETSLPSSSPSPVGGSNSATPVGALQVHGKEESLEKSHPVNGASDKNILATSLDPPAQSCQQNGSHKPMKDSVERKTNEREEGRSHRQDKTSNQTNDPLLTLQEEDQSMDHDSRQPSDEKYRRLKRKLKEVLEENERLSIELDRSNRRARNLRQEKNLLLDRLCAYERDSDSSPDTLSSISSDSELSDSSLNSYHRSRRTSPSERAVATAKKNQNLRAPVTSKSTEPSGSASQTTHHPKKTITKTAPRKSPAVLVRKEEKPPSIPSTITTVGSATQKPKRIHNTSKLRPALSSKVRKVQAIDRDERGNVKLPVTVGIITIMSLGRVVYDREAFHNERYIWPVGYKMSRSYNSMIDPQQQTTYTCSVIDDGEAPKFQIDAEDQPGNPIIAGTATGAWTHVVKTANQIRKRDHSNSASGPDYFGFSNATIAKMIQDLPNADKCKTYIMQRYEEPSAKSGPSSHGAKHEKRKISAIDSKVNGKSGDVIDIEGGGEEDQTDEDEGGEEDDDQYASLGTPGKKKARRSSLSPKARQNESDMEGADGKEDEDIDVMEEVEEVEVNEVEEDDDTQSEKDPEEMVDPRLSKNEEEPSHSTITPSIDTLAGVTVENQGADDMDVDPIGPKEPNTALVE